MTREEINVVQKYLDKKYKECPKGTKVAEIITWLYDQVTHEFKPKVSAGMGENPCCEIDLDGNPIPTKKGWEHPFK